MISISLGSQGTLCPKPTLSKSIDDPSETDLHPPDSAQSFLATPQQSLDHQTEEWTFKSNMLPINSDEIENWCEGVSHMLLSDAFVPVSEEIEENSTNLKAFVSSSPHENEEFAPSPSMRRKGPSVISDKVCYFKKQLTAVHHNRLIEKNSRCPYIPQKNSEKKISCILKMVCSLI